METILASVQFKLNNCLTGGSAVTARTAFDTVTEVLLIVTFSTLFEFILPLEWAHARYLE